MRYEFEFDSPNPMERIAKKKAPNIAKKANKFFEALGWVLYPEPAGPKKSGYECSVFDKTLEEEFEKAYGKSGPRGRLNEKDAKAFLDSMRAKYPEKMKEYYSDSESMINDANNKANEHEYNEIYK